MVISYKIVFFREDCLEVNFYSLPGRRDLVVGSRSEAVGWLCGLMCPLFAVGHSSFGPLYILLSLLQPPPSAHTWHPAYCPRAKVAHPRRPLEFAGSIYQARFLYLAKLMHGIQPFILANPRRPLEFAGSIYQARFLNLAKLSLKLNKIDKYLHSFPVLGSKTRG